MQHPFSKILGEFEGEDVNQEVEGQSRREAMQTVIQVGVGAVAVGVAGAASAQVTTQAIGEEGGPRPTTLAVGEEGGPKPSTRARGEEGGRPPAVTRAGPAHPEHAGEKVRSAMKDMFKAQVAMKKGDWSSAAASLTRVRKLAKPEKDKFGHYARLQKQRESMEKQLNKAINKALGIADKQAKADKLVPALKTYRKAKGLDEHYGFATRVEKALSEMEKHKDYKVALKKVEKLEAKEKPKATTLALGEEGGKPGVTTAIGEEGRKPPIRKTTLALGEEGGGRPGRGAGITNAVGEEGARKITTFAVGEEG